jgi:F420-non-reducing hydrogenase small subunit
MPKPKVAFYWNASCGGCEEAVVDLNEAILDVVDAVDIVFWPVALDFKVKDVEAMPDGSIAVSFINGGIRLTEQQEITELLRKKSGLVVAFGSCAHLGGIPGLANFYNKAKVFQRAYELTPSTGNAAGTLPQESFKANGHEVTLPRFLDEVLPIDRVIDVDYYLPGCPPAVDLIAGAVTAILKGELPEKGAVLAPNKSLCESCERNKNKPDKISISEFKRVYEVDVDPEKCFLEQGILCMGPATRSGCGERCINANMPCRGCFGPTDQVEDQGAKFLSSVASLIEADDEEEIKKIVDTIVDPAGTFYRFSLPASQLHHSKGVVRS